MTKYRNIKGPPSSGKTTDALTEAIERPGRYLFVMTRMRLIEEHYQTTCDQCVDKKVNALVRRIHSDHNANTGTNRSVKLSLRRQIEEFPADVKDKDHVVLFITHAMMMKCDLTPFAGWEMYIDENVNGIKSSYLRLPVMASVLDQFIKLERIGNGDWSFASVKSSAPSQAHIEADTCFKPLAELFRCMRGQHMVLFRTPDLVSLSGNPKKELHWLSYWDLSKLKMFKSVTLLAAGFEQSIMARAIKGLVDIEIVPVKRLRKVHPEVKICYFTASHRASTRLWGKEHGKVLLHKVGAYLSRIGADYYWSANKAVTATLSGLLKGTYVKPKQEGTNELKAFHTCVFLYSSKSQPIADSALRELLNISEDEIQLAREFEDIKQFVMRGIVRDWSYSGPYTIYVYDKEQADMLKHYLIDSGIGTASIEGIPEAGIMDHKVRASSRKSGSGLPKLRISYEEKKERDKLRKRIERSGVPKKKRGRKPKSSSLPSPTPLVISSSGNGGTP